MTTAPMLGLNSDLRRSRAGGPLMKFRMGLIRGCQIVALLAVLASVAACSSGPNIAPPPPRAELLGTPDRIASTAELAASIGEHWDRARTARVECGRQQLPAADHPVHHCLGVVRFRPGYAADVLYTIPATATAPEFKTRLVEVNASVFTLDAGDTSGRPWQMTTSAVGSALIGGMPTPTGEGEIVEVIEGERVLGQPVLGYRFGSGLAGSTYYMNAKKQLVRYVTKVGGLSETTETYYDFGTSVEIDPPHADQVKPG